MEQQYKTDAEIYAVLEREIIDLTIRPGSSLSENPLCARFGAPRSLIRVVLQKLQENGLVRIVPYKGTTVTRLNRRIVDELIYERTAVEGRILRDFAPNATPAQRAQIRARVDAYEALARAEGKAAAPQFVKQYRAVLAGVPDAQLPAAGVLRDYLFKDSRKGRVFPVSRPRKGVREAVLEYRILATAGESSLAEITLHTGRTHQIRVQFASRRHPLYGDGKYGSRQKGSIALQSCGLRFVHPDTGKPMAFSLPLPAAAPWKEFLELGE